MPAATILIVINESELLYILQIVSVWTEQTTAAVHLLHKNIETI